MTTRRARSALAVLATVGLLATVTACTGSSRVTTPGRTTPDRTAAAGHPTGADGSPHSVRPTRAAASPSPAVSPPRCGQAQLAVAVQMGGPTMPGIVARVVLRNRTASPCRVQGWPRFRVVAVDGRPAHVGVRRFLATGAWAYRNRPVDVPGHGRRYVSLLIGNPVTNDCLPRVTLVRIRPPYAARATTVRLRGSQWQVCRRHTVVVVSPVHA